MDLRVAAVWFDQTMCVDAYGTDSFVAQLEPLDYYKLDGASVKRRIMSTGPDVVLPSRMTIRIDDQVYLVGDKTPEHFQGNLIRNRYVMSGADSLVTVRSPAQVLQQAGGAEVWATLVFNKVQTDERFSSLPVAEFRVFLGSSETINEHDIVLDGQFAYLVIAPYKSDSGLISGVALRLEHAVPEAAMYVTKTYEPVSDTNVETIVPTSVLRSRWSYDFAYLSSGTPKYEHGDMTMLGLSSVFSGVKNNDIIECAGERWYVVTSSTHGDVIRMHVRRA